MASACWNLGKSLLDINMFVGHQCSLASASSEEGIQPNGFNDRESLEPFGYEIGIVRHFSRIRTALNHILPAAESAERVSHEGSRTARDANIAEGLEMFGFFRS